MNQEKIIELAEKAMDFSEKSILKLNWGESYKYWKALKFIADRMQSIPDKETAEMRRDIVNQSEIFLDRVVAFPLPASVTEKLRGKNVYMPMLMNNRWHFTQMEILKDCCLFGYLLSQITGSESYFYFLNTEEIDPEILKFVPGLNTIYKEHPTIDDQFKFLYENYQKMDILMLYGIYFPAADYVREYKELRPDGIIFTEMDFNINYYKNLTNPKNNLSIEKTLYEAMKQIDVCTNSTNFSKDFLNADPPTPKPVYYVTNGLMRPENPPDLPRENVILTVGRIGSEQKLNELLLAAFQPISGRFPDWKLKLIGPVDDRIKPWLDDYFTKYPEMRKKVIIPDRVFQKDELYEEYAKAKIFCLTSPSESIPNVYAEALFFGNFMVFADSIEEAPFMTAEGSIGEIYKQPERDSLIEKLVKAILYTQNGLPEKHLKRCREHFDRHFDYAKISKRIAYHLSEIEK